MSDLLNFHNSSSVDSITPEMQEECVEQKEMDFNISVDEEPFFGKADEDKQDRQRTVYGYIRSTEAADILNISTTLLRQLTDIYDEFLNVNKSGGGWREYTEKDIRTLEEIIKTKKEMRFNNDQMLEYLRTNSISKVMLSGNDSQKMEALFGILTDTMEDLITQGISDISNNIKMQLKEYNGRLLEQKDNDQDINELVKMQQEAIRDLKDDIEKKDALILELLQETKNNQERILEKVEEKKKKKFLFFK